MLGRDWEGRRKERSRKLVDKWEYSLCCFSKIIPMLNKATCSDDQSFLNFIVRLREMHENLNSVKEMHRIDI